MPSEDINKFKYKSGNDSEAPNYTIFWTFSFISASLISYYVYSHRKSLSRIESLNSQIDDLSDKLNCIVNCNRPSRFFEKSALNIEMAIVKDERDNIYGPLLDLKIGITISSSVSVLALIYPVSCKQVLVGLKEILYNSLTQTGDMIYNKYEALLGEILGINYCEIQ